MKLRFISTDLFVNWVIHCSSVRKKCPTMQLSKTEPWFRGRPVRKHWHFLLACPDNPYLLSFSKQLWEASNGWLKIQPYDREQFAGYYICKLISEGAIPYMRNLENLHYSGPSDLIEAGKNNSYVADRLKEKTFGEYLVHR